MREEPVPDATLAQIVRDEAGLIVAALYRRIGDFDVAEEAVQEAVIAALSSWRRDGIPPNPGAWLTLAARRRAIDRLRRSVREEKTVANLSFADSRAVHCRSGSTSCRAVTAASAVRREANGPA